MKEEKREQITPKVKQNKVETRYDNSKVDKQGEEDDYEDDFEQIKQSQEQKQKPERISIKNPKEKSTTFPL